MLLDALPPWARDALVLALFVYAVLVRLGYVEADTLLRLLVGVIEDSNDPKLKAAAKAAASADGVQPALHRVVKEETEEDRGTGPLPPGPPG